LELDVEYRTHLIKSIPQIKYLDYQFVPLKDKVDNNEFKMAELAGDGDAQGESNLEGNGVI
jgi:hypothetical protein